MNFRSSAFASMLVLLVAAQVGCSGAAPDASATDSSSEADLKKAGKGVAFADFAKDAKDMSDSMNGPDGCSFTTESKGGALVLTVTDDKSTATITVSSHDAITGATQNSGATRVYKVAGVGTVTLVTADDAFISAAIDATKTKSSATCEIDF